MILECTCALRSLLSGTHYSVGRQDQAPQSLGLNGQDGSSLSPRRRNQPREPWLSRIQGRERMGLNTFPIPLPPPDVLGLLSRPCRKTQLTRTPHEKNTPWNSRKE